MTDFEPRRSRLLIYVDLSEEIEYARIPIELFSSLDIVLLGIYPVSDQATPEQIRDNFGDEADQRLESAKETLALRDVESREILKYTSDPVETMNKVAREEQCDAILTPGDIESIERILIPVKGTENFVRMVKFVCDLLEESPRNITLIGFVLDEENESEHKAILEQFKSDLVEEGVTDDHIMVRIETVEDVVEGLIEEIDRYDVAVLGESEPQLTDVVVGSVHENVLNNTVVPLITVLFPGEDGQEQQMRED